MNEAKVLRHQPDDKHYEYALMGETLVCRYREDNNTEWNDVDIWHCAAENISTVGDACQAADDEFGTELVADWNRAIREEKKLQPPVTYLILKHFSEQTQYSIWSTETPSDDTTGASGAGYETALEAVRDFYPEGSKTEGVMLVDFTDMGAAYLQITYEELPKLVQERKEPIEQWLARQSGSSDQ
ncbi:hypothetical protein [Neptuniibacter halophilus]|uniref:hypothetical protein n=1 Tax=Neptuniibacter halophilus TaxID=651666 RepID=UPI00257369CB|nr:hypothetical protein [Neptuniibacter halophilus]